MFRSNSRRQFLQTSMAIGASTILTKNSPIRSANDEIGVAVVGLGGRGRDLLGSCKKCDGIKIVALCDADEKALAKQREVHPNAFSTSDVRKVLERKDVDVVVTATPNFWHALVTIWACQAGKHVYVEKPVSHSVFESVQITAAATKYQRVVQGGFQNRAERGLKEFYKRLHDGEWGDVKQVRGLCYRKRNSIGKRDQPLPIPKHIDYGLWLGPAEDQEIVRPRLHYDWHWDFNTGNGDFGNQGPHELDLMRWALGDPMDLPRTVECLGGRFLWNDAGNTANVQIAKFDYGGVPCLFEVNNVVHDVNYEGTGVGVIITCENAEFRGGRGGGRVYDPEGQEIARFRGGGNHMQNFFDAVRANDNRNLNSEVTSAALSSSLAHMANACYLTGQAASPEEVAATYRDEVEMNEAIERYSGWLSNAKVDLNESQWTLGPKLSFDSERMRFTDQAGELANRSLAVKREYTREKFTVKDEV